MKQALLSSKQFVIARARAHLIVKLAFYGFTTGSLDSEGADILRNLVTCGGTPPPCPDNVDAPVYKDLVRDFCGPNSRHVAAAAGFLSRDEFAEMVIDCGQVSRKFYHPNLVIPYEELEDLIYDDVRKHCPAIAAEFARVIEDWDPFGFEDWDEKSEVAKIISAAAQVSTEPTAREASPATCHRRQTGGSDSDDSASDDHDSHVLAYHQHFPRLVCWTSALEVVSASIPAAKSHQKYPRYKGNYRLELSDYPDNFTPDYSFLTLARAAIEVGYTATHDVLDSALQATVGLPGHLLFQIYNRFERPLLPASAGDGTGATVDEGAGLSTLARQKDPGGVYMIGVRRVVKGVCRAWAEDPIHGEDIVHDVEVSTYISLLQHCDLIKWDASLGTYAKLWARSHLRDVLMRLKICIPRSVVAKRLALAKQLLASHLDDAPVDNAGCTSWEQHRRGLVANVEKYQKAISGLIVVGTSSLDAPLSDDEEDSLSVVDIMPGAPGDMVSDIERSEVTTVVRECLNNTVLDELLEKIQTVSTKIREDGESDMEYLARVAAKNGSVVKLIKKTIGPDGLSALTEYL
ncbi:sigma-70 family RNA polymerase sigma factor [Acidithiobacillus ferrooxidans]|uniref:hypothetical protein n=1 Tax=Acidithiobacillus ferrooxidans TaxID=920 RepID=UPI001C079598|nr:hypothetical protein [Acidithiobacillus ferrooxidans]MBU2772667.1 sigma-70 family RNA polymerase sigma factor [Acidithiobacillus ferrooxidans]